MESLHPLRSCQKFEALTTCETKHHLPGRDTVTTVARFLGSTAVITMQTEEVRGGCVECV